MGPADMLQAVLLYGVCVRHLLAAYHTKTGLEQGGIVRNCTTAQQKQSEPDVQQGSHCQVLWRHGQGDIRVFYRKV